MLTGWTPYQTVGDWPGWLALAASLYMLFVGRRNRPEENPPPEEEVRPGKIRRRKEDEPEPDEPPNR